jgi:hypothetical protein
MRNGNLLLGSVACLSIALASPSFAQSLPRYSTPQEQAQTDSLNAQQASEPGIILSVPATPPATNPADIAAYNAAVMEQNAQAQARYEAQLKDYHNKKNAYDAEKQGYQQQLDSFQNRAQAYGDQTRAFADRRADFDRDSGAVAVTVAPVARALDFPDRPLVDIGDVVDPDSELSGVPVEDRGGYRIGRFSHVTRQDGGPEKAVITLRNNKSVAVYDDHLRFDPDREMVVADLTFDELNNMPARF